MDYKKSIALAKVQIGLVEGAERWITTKGRIRKIKPNKSEGEVYHIYVKKGVIYVCENGKQIQPKKEEKPKAKKTSKSISDVSGTSDETVSGDSGKE